MKHKGRKERWKFKGVVLEVNGRYYKWTHRGDMYLWLVENYAEQTTGRDLA